LDEITDAGGAVFDNVREAKLSDSRIRGSWRRELGIRVHAARKARMRRLSYEWLAGLREIVIDPVRCPKTYEEFTLKEYLRNSDGTWEDEIPDGQDHSIDAVRYAVMDDVLRG
jgi:phage terminase large subunit